MPEKTGTVTSLITNPKKNNEVFGLNIDGDEYLYSFEEYRGEPFDLGLVGVGCKVGVEYQDVEKAGKTKRYISVLEVLREGDPADPLPGLGRVDRTPDTQVSEWGYRQRDILVLLESCTKGACGVYAAALAGGALKAMPGGGELTSLARTLETHNIERFRALEEDL